MTSIRNFTIRRTSVLAICIALAVVAGGCASNDLVGTPKSNQPPDVWLSAAPPEGTVSDYTLHLFWGGWDPDGDISHFEYCITDNVDGIFNPVDTVGVDKWFPVFGNDSTFTFTADELADSSSTDPFNLKPVEFVRSHTFFIRSIDNDGLASEKPAYRSFTARTLSPVVDILVPRRVGSNPAQVPPISSFRWIGKDYVSNVRQVQEPDSVRWIMISTLSYGDSWTNTIEYIRSTPDAPEWSDWQYYRAPGDSGKTWTTRPLEFGPYVFAVQVMDEARAVSPVFDEARNVRRVLVSPKLTGPVLTVFNKYMGSIITSSPSTPTTILDLPARVPMSFRFSADASSYGGVVSGYRYGWDIQDLNDPTQWDIDFTPFFSDRNTAESPARTFEFDSHTFHVEVIDNSGFTSRAGIRLNIVPFTFQKNLLVVDDYDERGSPGFLQTNGGAPSDAEHDQFWRDMLVNVKDFDPAVDLIEVKGNLPIQAVADYKTMIWDALSGYNIQSGISVLPELVHFIPSDPSLGGVVTGKVQPNILALYMAAGGHLLLCGEQPMTAVINPTVFAGGTRSPAYPLIFRYELTGDQDGSYEDSDIGEEGVGELSFAYNECCLNVVDISAITNKRLIRQHPQQACSVILIRDHSSRTDGLRFAIPMDDSLSFPELELRPEVAADGKEYAPARRGLINDIYNPPYFQDVCSRVTETQPLRECFQPMYGHGCLNTASLVYGAHVGFWTSQYGDRLPAGGGVAARSAVWGFEPVFFKPTQIQKALEVILFDEWQLPRQD